MRVAKNPETPPGAHKMLRLLGNPERAWGVEGVHESRAC